MAMRYCAQGFYYPKTDPALLQAHMQENEVVARQGFIVVQPLGPGSALVQSVENGLFYHAKYFRRAPEGYTAAMTAGPCQYVGNEPQEYRISTAENAARRLPDVTQFPQLAYWQHTNLAIAGQQPEWALYYEFNVGGNLEELRDRFYAAKRRIPESFIWHVCAELCKTLAFLHYGMRNWDDEHDGWEPIHHRAITERNVWLHFRYKKRFKPKSGEKICAFPEVILADYGVSFEEGQNADELRPSLFPRENQANTWEDVYQLGAILRGLCMTHVPFPADDPNDPNDVIPRQRQDERLKWGDRPDSRTLRSVNTHNLGENEAPYSDYLLDTLARFERPDMSNTAIENGAERTRVPSMEWVVQTLLPIAMERVGHFRDDPALLLRENYFGDTIGVDWASTKDPMPYEADASDPDVRARMTNMLLRTDWQQMYLRFTPPNPKETFHF